MLISFVILHYQAYEDTIECVESILDLYSKKYRIKIFIIDNNSPNKSGEILYDKYSKNDKIEFIFSKENLGFARGNNLGFVKAKKLKSNFIVMANNDTIFTDPDFINKIIQLYNEEKYGVLGPDIISSYDGIHQNPSKGFPITKNFVMKKIVKLYIGKILCIMDLDDIIKNRINETYNQNHKFDYKTLQLVDSNGECVLHGSCLIFSDVYINKFDGLSPVTFMYYEENILSYICTTNNIKQLYSPDLRIIHKGKSATNTAYKSLKKKRIFYYKESIKSMKALLNLIKSNNN